MLATVANRPQKRSLRKCPRCQTGTEREAVICGSCGAVLRPIAAADDILESVICADCGAANPPHENQCRSCGATLLQACPRCQSTFRTDETACPQCGLERREFYAESARAAHRTQEVRGRHVLAGQMVFLGFAAGLLLIALWHQTQGTTSLRNVAIVVALLYVAFWTIGRVVR